MNVDDKETQKIVVSLTKLKDIDGLVRLLGDMSSHVSEVTVAPQSVKMAINLSASLIVDNPDSSVDLTKYSDSLDILLERFPQLTKLDNINYTLVRLRVARGQILEAWEVAVSCKESRLRTFGVILRECGKQGKSSLAAHVLDELDSRGIVPGETEMADVVRALANSNEAEWVAGITIILERLFRYHEFLHSDAVLTALHELLEVKGVTCAQNQEIETDKECAQCGVCPVTGMRLQLLDLSDEEIEEMLALTRSLAKEATALREGSGCDFDFDKVIQEAMPSGRIPTVILDAANIAHTNQNFDGGYFRFDQIDDILNNFESKDRLVVIHEKWLNPDRDLALHYVKPDGEVTRKKKRKTALPQLGQTLVEGRAVKFVENTVYAEESETKRYIKHPVPVEIIEKWKANQQLLVVPHGQNDDWFWMHICLQSMKQRRDSANEVVLISNDQMRDHFWRMKNPRFFEKFRTNHVCNFSIQYGEDMINHYSFKHRLSFSFSIQKQKKDNGEVVWHIPKKSQDGASVTWFVFSLR